MKYIVTGGAGFIGSNLADALLDQGHEVRIIDNLSTGKKENLNSRADFHQTDIRNFKAISPLFEGMDGVFHIAALPRVQESILHPAKTNDSNITGTLNVLLAARDAKVKRVVYSASSSAYGNTAKLPLVEDMKPSPMSPYGLQKYVGEEYCRLFSLLFDLETVSLRYFNVYGHRMADKGAYVTVVAIFLRQRARGEPLTICGDGGQTRDFTHVQDVVRANILAMESKKVGKGEVINIGAGQNYSVNYVAELIGGPKKNLPVRIEPRHTLADNSKAKELLDWFPETRFEEEIGKLKNLKI